MDGIVGKDVKDVIEIEIETEIETIDVADVADVADVVDAVDGNIKSIK